MELSLHLCTASSCGTCNLTQMFWRMHPSTYVYVYRTSTNLVLYDEVSFLLSISILCALKLFADYTFAVAILEPSANILFGRYCVTVKMDVERTRTMPHCSLLPLQRLWVRIRSTFRCLLVDHSVILVWSVHRFARLATVAQIIHRYHQCLAPQQLPPITRFYYTGSLGSQNLTDQNI